VTQSRTTCPLCGAERAALAIEELAILVTCDPCRLATLRWCGGVGDVCLSLVGARAPAHTDVFPAVVAERPLAEPAELEVLRGHCLSAPSAQLNSLVHDLSLCHRQKHERAARPNPRRRTRHDFEGVAGAGGAIPARDREGEPGPHVECSGRRR
jgi:hypothetical protein